MQLHKSLIFYFIYILLSVHQHSEHIYFRGVLLPVVFADRIAPGIISSVAWTKDSLLAY